MVISPSCTQIITLHEDRWITYSSTRASLLALQEVHMGTNQGSVLIPRIQSTKLTIKSKLSILQSFGLRNLVLSILCNTSYFQFLLLHWTNSSSSSWNDISNFSLITSSYRPIPLSSYATLLKNGLHGSRIGKNRFYGERSYRYPYKFT